eukprot:GHVP01027975.1.p1 GENE.GHVP01027975.1~~GHVP01027975.1.p1  ORF type:complete len:193 (+),score=30.79 GHVP01027975.1:1027-1605(+)
MCNQVYDFMEWIYSFIVNKRVEITLTGLCDSGKTTLVRYLTANRFDPTVAPTLGFSMAKTTKNGVVFKIWDLGGAKRLRSMWERYCRNVDLIIFAVDSGDRKRVEASKVEFEKLVSAESLIGVPILLLATKSDLEDALSIEEIKRVFEVDKVISSDIKCLSISCKTGEGVDSVTREVRRHAVSDGFFFVGRT